MNHEIDIKRIGARRAVVLRDVTLFGVEIPEGFETDGASVPRLFWWIISPYTEALYAALRMIFNFRWMVKMPSDESGLIECSITI